MKTIKKGTRWEATRGMVLESSGSKPIRCEVVRVDRQRDEATIRMQNWVQREIELRLSMLEGNLTGWRPV